MNSLTQKWGCTLGVAHMCYTLHSPQTTPATQSTSPHAESNPTLKQIASSQFRVLSLAIFAVLMVRERGERSQVEGRRDNVVVFLLISLGYTLTTT